MFSDVWNENAAIFKRLVKIHSNPPILYYGINRNELYYMFFSHLTMVGTTGPLDN